MNVFAMILSRNFLFLLLLTFGIASCDEVQEKEIENKKTTPTPAEPEKEEPKKIPVPKEDEYTEAPVDLSMTKEDIQYLSLHDIFPMGSNYEMIHKRIPSLKGIRAEGGSDELAAQGLTEAKTKITMLRKPVDVEFNFRNDSLYSFYYTITEQDYNKANKIYKGIQQFYNKNLGQGQQLTAEEETRHLQTTVWTSTFPYGVMTYNTNTGIISWGFQNTKP